jgi:hypothetical protein
MKLIIRIYYLFFILVGGYRHYSYEYEFITSIQNGDNINHVLLFGLERIEIILFSFAIGIFILPTYKTAHLIFWFILFSLDLYFQNIIKFESSIILTHFFPLFVFLILKYPTKTNEIKLSAVYVISIGYCTSFLQKVLSGWLLNDDLVIFGYIQEFSKGYGIKGLFSDLILQISNRWFWKITDYIILLFQLSFLLNFITNKFVNHILFIASIFHILILLFLDIGVFFPYMLIYCLILTASSTTSICIPFSRKSFFYFLVGFLLILFNILNFEHSVHFFFNINEYIYMFSDFLMNIFCFMIFLYNYVFYLRKSSFYEC